MSIQQNFPAISPSLNLNFARSKTLDPRITFSRTSTATRVNEQGLVEVVSADIPRFDHEYDASTGVVKSLGLLVEEQRSNLVTYSSDMNQWSSNGTPTYVNNDTTAPDGTLTADKLTQVGIAAAGRRIEVGISTNTTYTVSSFIKPTDQPITRIGVYSNIGTWYGNVDTYWDSNGSPTTNASSGASNIKYEPYPNGWYRVSFQFTSPETINGDIQYYHMPDRAAEGKSAWFWGAQLEVGEFPTSYIPRPDTSTATRNPDNVTMTGDNFSDWYNQSEGTFVTQHRQQDMKVLSVNYGIYSLSNSPTNTERLRFFSGAGRTPVFNTIVGGLTIAYINAAGSLGVNFLGREGDLLKITTSYSQEDAAMVVENSDVAIDDEDIVTPSLLNNMIIGGGGAGVKELCGHISQLTYYPRRLTNTQLQNLTK